MRFRDIHHLKIFVYMREHDTFISNTVFFFHYNGTKLEKIKMFSFNITIFFIHVLSCISLIPNPKMIYLASVLLTYYLYYCWNCQQAIKTSFIYHVCRKIIPHLITPWCLFQAITIHHEVIYYFLLTWYIITYYARAKKNVYI